MLTRRALERVLDYCFAIRLYKLQAVVLQNLHHASFFEQIQTWASLLRVTCYFAFQRLSKRNQSIALADTWDIRNFHGNIGN